MSINVEEAQRFEEFGIASVDEDGNVLFYLTSGDGDPTGLAAPVNTLFINRLTGQIFTKFGPQNIDWTQTESNFNLDGGVSDSVYTADQCIDAGGASGS